MAGEMAHAAGAGKRKRGEEQKYQAETYAETCAYPQVFKHAAPFLWGVLEKNEVRECAGWVRDECDMEHINTLAEFRGMSSAPARDADFPSVRADAVL